jgi:hypothetical protein
MKETKFAREGIMLDKLVSPSAGFKITMIDPPSDFSKHWLRMSRGLGMDRTTLQWRLTEELSELS